VSALIDRDDVKAIAKAPTEIVLDMRMQTTAVHHDHRMPVFIAPIQMMQSNAVALEEMAVYVVEPHGVRTLGDWLFIACLLALGALGRSS
jgi:hypothetical protein